MNRLFSEKLYFLSFLRETCVASITQRFLVPVSTVPAKNAWHNDPLLCPKYNEKRVADYESRCLRKRDLKNCNNLAVNKDKLAYSSIIDIFSLRTCPRPLAISLCFLVLPNKKRFTDHSFLKLTSGYVNQTQADDFTCTIVSISIVPWFAGAIEWSLGVIAPSVFMTAIICSVALIYVWRINPVNLKVLVRENININTAKMHYLSY